MKAQGRVRGILIEGSDGQEYLLGFGTTTEQNGPPRLSCRQADGRFELFKDSAAASKVAMKQLGLTGPHVIGPGMGKDFFLWFAFQEALKAFPPVPAWPTWSS